MATIKFRRPFFDKNDNVDTKNKDLKKTPGVYIVGVKIPVNIPPQYDLETSNNEKFCPLYVGIRDNLQVRITGHRKKNSSRGELNYNKELFDLEINGNADKLYKSIGRLLSMRDRITDNHTPNGKSRTTDFPILCRKCAEELVMFHRLHNEKNLLIWFPNPAFFNIKINNRTKTFSSHYEYHHGDSYRHKWSLDYDLKHPGAADLAKIIDRTKDIIESNFWYAFVTVQEIADAIKQDSNDSKQPKHPKLEDAMQYDGTNYMNGRSNGPGRRLCESVENATKKALEEKGIFTYAKATKVKEPYKIDFTNLAEDIVNMKGVPFNNTTNPLIININP